MLEENKLLKVYPGKFPDNRKSGKVLVAHRHDELELVDFDMKVHHYNILPDYKRVEMPDKVERKRIASKLNQRLYSILPKKGWDKKDFRFAWATIELEGKTFYQGRLYRRHYTPLKSKVSKVSEAIAEA